jgi:hypothetical protein
MIYGERRRPRGSQRYMSTYFCIERWHSYTKDLLQATRSSNTGNAYNLNFDNGNINNDDKTNDDNNRAKCVREHIFTFKEVYGAFLACRKQKRNTINALKFENNLECNIERLVYELNTRLYNPARSVCFTILKPKPREIFAADFRDRVVHHLLFNYLNPAYEKKFIYDSFACRKNKGTLAAVKRLQKQTRKITTNNIKRAYYLQLDIHNFFMSIDKNILFCLIKKHLKDRTFRWLAKTLIFHEPTEQYLQKSTYSIRSRVPKHKSLLNTRKNIGLPIGNLTSQFFANVYLNDLDQFVKHKLKAKYYVRYVDDFVLLHESKEKLAKWKQEIEVFINTKLNLKLKPITKIQPISNGINFVGYIIRPFYLLPRNRNTHNLKQTLKTHEKKCIKTSNNQLILHYEHIPTLARSLNSYFGHLRYAKSKRLMQSIKDGFFFLHMFFLFWNFKVMNRFVNKKTTFKNQYEHFRTISKNSILLVQVGKFYRALHQDALLISKIFDYYVNTTKHYAYIDIPEIELEFVISALTDMQKIVMIIKQIDSERPIKRRLDKVISPKICLINQ